MPANRGDLQLTGERTLPGIPSENYWFRRHEAAYLFLLRYVNDLGVLEIGCGEGYGAELLAGRARRVVAVDYDEAAIAHAGALYRDAAFLRANLAALPVRSGSFDVVASLQVIEHVWDHPQFVAECLRAVRPGGRLLITTPNRLTFSPGRDVAVNPFHTHEFVADELAELLTRSGAEVEDILGLHAARRLRELDRIHGGSFTDAQLARPPDEWSAGLARDVAAVRAADFRVVGQQLSTCLDLVAIARRPG